MALANSTLELTLRGRVLAWLAALAAGASWLGGDANARLAAALLATPLVVDFVAKQRRLDRTEIHVAPRRTTAGAVFTESVQLTHRGRRPLRECMLAEPRTMRTEPAALLPELRAGEPCRVELRQRSPLRSHVLERVFVLVSHWPLGMFRTRSVVRVHSDLVTEPARVPLHPNLVPATDTSEWSADDRSPLPGPEFHSLREHQAEEDVRLVHALRSAALGTLVRRVNHGRLPRSVGIVLDLRRPPGRPLSQGQRRFEWSLGACATMLALLRARGSDALVLVLGEEPATIDVRGPLQERELLTLLAEAGPSPHRTLPPELFAAVQQMPHCFWIPAGAYLAAPEFAAMSGVVTLVDGEFE
jgi:uncharacterized protein (DUF58 family)